MHKLILTWIITGFSIMASFGQNQITYKKKKLIYSDSFGKQVDSSDWQIEMPFDSSNRVFVANNRLWLDTKDGVTVWYKQPLKGNYCIEYNRCVVVDSGANDRLSDMNNFWQASDPKNPRLFARDGVFESYDNLQLYYAGIGGNYNSTTRLRRYGGSKEKPVIKEYLDSGHLLKPNHIYNIHIVYLNHTTQLYVDGDLWFSFTDTKPLPTGYFGLRSTKSRQWVSGLKIWTIKQAGIRTD